jgi:soluble P-type ATPase
MNRRREQPTGLEIPIPGSTPLRIGHAAFDYNGTLAARGALIRGVAGRLRRLAELLPVTVLTADTFGTARTTLRGLPVSVHTIRTGRDKERFIRRWQRVGVVAVGNGNNDAPMLRAATLGIAVLGPEGFTPGTLRAATIAVARIEDAIDLLLEPKRMAATLRS